MCAVLPLLRAPGHRGSSARSVSCSPVAGEYVKMRAVGATAAAAAAASRVTAASSLTPVAPLCGLPRERGRTAPPGLALASSPSEVCVRVVGSARRADVCQGSGANVGSSAEPEETALLDHITGITLFIRLA
ncbi:zinc finger protein 1035 isoform X5 [Scophthalmus maximus]|uniref:zinc finger protein 1035 isoform X5 n=1 Tax=Scophthalmus maximus TaxID=52904 RepID=UPI001FA90627|nr:zinc finger protein 1035 isoform X5 [Scophthalmus maximus]